MILDSVTMHVFIVVHPFFPMPVAVVGAAEHEETVTAP